MEILLAIHDKKLISNLEFQYLNEDELLYKSTAISALCLKSEKSSTSAKPSSL